MHPVHRHFEYLTAQLSAAWPRGIERASEEIMHAAVPARNSAAVPMITRGGLATVTRHLAMEYAKESIRVSAVAPGVLDTPLQNDAPKDVMESRSPMGRTSTVQEIVDAVMHLNDAETVTGHILYVDGGAHFGHW